MGNGASSKPLALRVAVPRTKFDFPSSPDEEPTPTDIYKHEPIGHTVRTMQRRILIMMVVCIASLAGHLASAYYQIAHFEELLQQVQSHNLTAVEFAVERSK